MIGNLCRNHVVTSSVILVDPNTSGRISDAGIPVISASFVTCLTGTLVHWETADVVMPNDLASLDFPSKWETILSITVESMPVSLATLNFDSQVTLNPSGNASQTIWVMDTFGARLEAARKSKGLSGSQLGELVGATNGAVAQWESNAVTPHFSKLAKIAAALNTTLDHLILGHAKTLSLEAKDFAVQYDRLNATEKERFQAALLLAKSSPAGGPAPSSIVQFRPRKPRR